MIRLKEVKLKNKKIKDYSRFLNSNEKKELKNLSSSLFGKKIIHINATPLGGGVAEILHSMLPLMIDLGIPVSWYVIMAPKNFFEITKKIHNLLQGKKSRFTKKELEYYFLINKKLANEFKKINFDLAVVNDPQPAAIINYFHQKPMIFRLHIDLSSPEKKVIDNFLPIFEKYEKTIFSLPEFVPKSFPKSKVKIIPPAIDPLSEKNKIISQKQSRKILFNKFGISSKNPLLVWVSRFDPFKRPFFVLDVFNFLKKRFPNISLVMAGIFLAQDDPEAEEIFKKVREKTKDQKNIFLFSRLNQLKDLNNDQFINLIQNGADVILQPSSKEGFGLTCTEAMWKGKVVIAGRAGGLKYQIKNGENGFIVENQKKAVEIIENILENKRKIKLIGKKAHQRVKEKFLLTRLLIDHLKIYKEIFYGK